MAGAELLLPWLGVAAVAVALPALGLPRRGGRSVDALLAAVLVLLAAWPLLDDPFETDTVPLRVGFARYAPFADWNHPPLAYLLNQPARWSLRPEVVRLGPLAWLLAEVALLQLLARRWGGRLAGVLAALWMAAEVRRRMGLQDLGDWDLAGCFVLGLLLWLERSEREPPRGAGDAFEVAGLVALGIASSWLVWPVGVAAALVLAHGAWRGRVGWVPALATAGVVVLATWPLWGVVALGRDIAVELDPNVRDTGLVQEIVQHWPVGRALAMGLPLVLGVGWLAGRRSRLDARLALAALVAVLAALGAAARVSHVNGGYYVGLLTPVLLAASAAGTVAVGRAMLPTGFATAGAGRLVPVLVVAGATAWQLPPAPRYAAEATLPALLPDLARRSHADGRPIVTNLAGLGPQLAYARAQAGLGDLRDVVAPPHASVVAAQLRFGPCLDCVADPACRAAARDAWVVMERRQRSADELACTEVLVAGCTALHGARVVDDVFVVDCRPEAASAQPAGAPGPGDDHLAPARQLEEDHVDRGVAPSGAGEPPSVR